MRPNYVLERTPGTFLVSSELRSPAPLNTALGDESPLVVATLLFPLTADAKRSVAYCPELPPHSDLVWEYLEGGDFIGCIATRQADIRPLFGVYLGQRPSFVSDASRRKARGIVGGLAAHWQLPGPGSDDGAVLESHVNLRATEMDLPLQSVVWSTLHLESTTTRHSEPSRE